MELLLPAYYHSFHCLAADCPDSCCKEWEIDIDDDTAQVYRNLPGELGSVLRDVLRETESGGTVMTIRDGRCPMWQQDGLCRIQAELGHDALCQTCRQFPRLRHDYGDFVELGLELSCPEAARLILTSPEQTLLTQSQPGGICPEYDTETMDILRRSRHELLRFLDTANCTAGQLLAVILLFSHSVQAELDGADPVPFCPDTLLQTADTFAKEGNLSLVFDFFLNLEILTEKWRTLLNQPVSKWQFSPFLPALARYFILRYWYQAVSDYDIVCRGKLIVVSCLLISALGGDFSQTAQLFSKEIENNADNVEAILDGAYCSPALTDVNLISLLFS